jgi:multiple sugar transport system ATP-binding protein
VATIDFEHVGKVFAGGVRALDDVSLHVDDSERLVVVGPSGCGKSTLLRVLAGLEGVSTGTIRIDARIANDLSPQARNIAMVFQDYALYPHMTVRANLAFPLRMRAVSRTAATQRIAEVAALLDIVPLLDRLPKHLSGGQRQRVAMGRALVRNPSAFLLDEPLSNLDAKLRVQVRADIVQLQERTRTTMLYVTHDQVEAMTLGHRVAVLHQGRLQQLATPREVYDRPANAFVAGFIGSPPMNLFAAHVSGSDVRCAVFAEQRVPLPPDVQQRCPAGAAVTVGIRPEALQVAAPSADAALSGTVEHVEALGHETLVYVRLGGADDDPLRCVACLAGMHEFERGAPLRLGVAVEHVYVFDAAGTAIFPLPLTPSVPR